jgi:hypothetical protein
MNCIPGLRIWRSFRTGQAGKGKTVIAICLLFYAACGASASESPEATEHRIYDIRYLVFVDPASGTAKVELKLLQPRALLRELVMQPDFERLGSFEGDGTLQIDEQVVRWNPPTTGGALRWTVKIKHRRNDSGYDAWLDPDWGLFRAEDIIPRARTRSLRGAHSRTQLKFKLPNRWSAVTQYYSKNGQFDIDNKARRFDEPSGWIALGDIGIRRDTIAGMRVAVVGPTGHSIRRLDTLALLNWTLPELARLLPNLPARLTVFSAGDPMWRGGLSAPQSLFVHAERPLISENATSTLLHEVMHSSLGITAVPGYDWIIEGLAEYYSLELLGRSGSISTRRHEQATRQQAKWAADAEQLCTPISSGATTAMAVKIFGELDQEIRRKSDQKSSLDDVVRSLALATSPIDLEILITAASKLIVNKPDTLRIDNLPGCRKIVTNSAIS